MTKTQNKTGLHYIDQSAITLPNGHTVRRGDLVEYATGVYRYHAIIEDWSKSGNTLTIRKVITKYDLEGNIKSYRLQDGHRDVIKVRHDSERGDYESSRFHDIAILFSRKNPIIKVGQQ